jgi:hypothetical protein
MESVKQRSFPALRCVLGERSKDVREMDDGIQKRAMRSVLKLLNNRGYRLELQLVWALGINPNY